MAGSLGRGGGGHKLRSNVLLRVLFGTLLLLGMATIGAAPSVTAAVEETCATDVELHKIATNLLQEIANSSREMANSLREMANSLREMANSSQEMARASKSIVNQLSSIWSWIKVAAPQFVGNLGIEIMKLVFGYYITVHVHEVVDQRREARPPQNDLEAVLGQRAASPNEMAVFQFQLDQMLEQMADANSQVVNLQAQVDAMRKEEANRKANWVQECLGDRRPLNNHNISIWPGLDSSLHVTTDYALKKAAGYLSD